MALVALDFESVGANFGYEGIVCTSPVVQECIRKRGNLGHTHWKCAGNIHSS